MNEQCFGMEEKRDRRLLCLLRVGEGTVMSHVTPCALLAWAQTVSLGLWRASSKAGARTVYMGVTERAAWESWEVSLHSPQTVDTSPALCSAPCVWRGYPVGPEIKREIKSLPHQLFDSGRKKRKSTSSWCSLSPTTHALTSAKSSTKETGFPLLDMPWGARPIINIPLPYSQ